MINWTALSVFLAAAVTAALCVVLPSGCAQTESLAPTPCPSSAPTLTASESPETPPLSNEELFEEKVYALREACSRDTDHGGVLHVVETDKGATISLWEASCWSPHFWPDGFVTEGAQVWRRSIVR